MKPQQIELTMQATLKCGREEAVNKEPQMKKNTVVANKRKLLRKTLP